MSNGKGMMTHSIVTLIKKALHKNESILSTYRSFKGNVKVELDLSSYETKADLKDATGIDTFDFALKTNLVSLKTEVD